MSTPRREQKLRDRWEQQLRADPAVTRTLLLVLLTVATYGDRDGSGITTGQARLCAVTGLKETTVRRQLVSGIELGYLVRLSRGHRRGDGNGVPSVYQLALPATHDRLSGESTGHPLPVEDPSQPAAHDRLSASQPVKRHASTGETGASQPVARGGLPGVDLDQEETTRRAGWPEHAYEPNARAALATLRTEAHLTTGADELLCLAYEAGNGDPWQGYQTVKAVTLDGLNGARDHSKVLRHRLGLLQAVR